MKHIRNFNIIAHIDSGKSTLADRLLELTGTVSSQDMREQFLDMMDLERERGITIKMQPVRMIYKEYVLNLVDTPGHVDFSYEVSRSLAAVEGAILLVDATKGIQAQTLANLELAQKQNLVIIPVVNKIDLQHAQVAQTLEEVSHLLDVSGDDILTISAKHGTNIEQVLEAVINKIPAPNIEINKPFRALIFDSKFDAYKGIIAYVRVVEGSIRSGEKMMLLAAQATGEAKELGFFIPELSPENQLVAGEIGYIATGIKEPGKVRAGDTIVASKDSQADPLPGYQEPKPMIFASLYPANPDDFDELKEALAQLKLQDPSLVFESERRELLGRGFRCGFLGTLHTEIVSERIRREFHVDLIISTASVVYKVVDQQGKEHTIYSASDWPDPSEIKEAHEPWVALEIVTPTKFIGSVLDLLKNSRGHSVATEYLTSEKVKILYEVPLREIITAFYDNLKSATQGYASMNYTLIGYRPADLVKMEVLVAGKKEEAFSTIIPQEEAYQEGKRLVEKLKKALPSQQFAVPLQAVIGGKIIARETLSARRKDVTGALYGGDYSRKRKLLEKQKKGKKKLQARGQLKIPPDVFLKIFRG